MTVHELKHRHRQEARVSRRPVVAVVGSHDKFDERQCAVAAEVVAKAGYDLLTGGGPGVMEAVSRAYAAHASRGLIIGVLPSADLERGAGYRTKAGYPNPYIEMAIYTHLPISGNWGTDSLSRNHIVVLSADAVIALPWGNGTRSEMQLADEYGIPVMAYGWEAAPRGVTSAASVEDLSAFLADVLASWGAR